MPRKRYTGQSTSIFNALDPIDSVKTEALASPQEIIPNTPHPFIPYNEYPITPPRHSDIETINLRIHSLEQQLKNDYSRKDSLSALENEILDKISDKFKNSVTRDEVQGVILQTLATVRINSQPETQTPNPEDEAETFTSETRPTHPTIDPNFYLEPFASKVILKALQLGRNLYIEGPTGCGKTATITQICTTLGLSIGRINPHDGVTRESFIGKTELVQTESGSITQFFPGALPFAMTNGLPFLIDEIDYLTPNLAAIFNPVAERGGKLYIPETNQWISPKKGFCIFATANTGGKGDNVGQYSGTEVQNTALLDRFAYKLKMDYLPQEEESKMLKRRFSQAELVEVYKMVVLASEVRQAFAKGELAITLSTRKLIDYFEQRENGFSKEESLSLSLLSWLDDDDKQLVMSYVDRLEVLQ